MLSSGRPAAGAGYPAASAVATKSGANLPTGSTTMHASPAPPPPPSAAPAGTASSAPHWPPDLCLRDLSADGTFRLCSVVVGATFKPEVHQEKLRISWEDALCTRYGVAAAPSCAGALPTHFDKNGLDSRAVTFGDGVVVLIANKGRIVAHAPNKAEEDVRSAVSNAAKLLERVTGDTFTTTEAKEEALSIVCDDCKLIHTSITRDVLWLDKLACRFPSIVQYEPEVVPGAIIRIPDTHGCLTIFDSGKVLISGVRNRTEAVALWHAFKRVCFGVPPPTATTPSSATQRPPTTQSSTPSHNPTPTPSTASLPSTAQSTDPPRTAPNPTPSATREPTTHTTSNSSSSSAGGGQQITSNSAPTTMSAVSFPTGGTSLLIIPDLLEGVDDDLTPTVTPSAPKRPRTMEPNADTM